MAHDTSRTSFDGGVGTTYRNVSRFLGQGTLLRCTVESVEPGRRYIIVGRNRTVTSEDTITVDATADRAEVQYRVEMTFPGLASLSPLLAPFMKKLGDDTATRLERMLDGKAGQ